MSSKPSPRVSQRQPKACKECTRRKIRCDKRNPCTACVQRSKTCTREIVRVSRADTVHRQELAFLKSLAESLESSRDADLAIASIYERISLLEHGSPSTVTRVPASSPSSDRDQSTPTAVASAATTAILPEASQCPTNASFISEHDDQDKHASKIRSMEFLAWGRQTETCFPHRRCQCRSGRPYAQMASINADPGWSGIQKTPYQLPQMARIPKDQAKLLVHFHLKQIQWHHNVFHAPTFLAQCEEYWADGTVHHPLWIALYLSVMSVSLWTALNAASLTSQLGLDEAMVGRLFRAMMQVLNDQCFMENLSLFSIQAIVLSTRIAHNLDFSDFNAILVGAAIRIAHCLGLHMIPDTREARVTDNTDQWYAVVEAEVGRRCWMQLVIQDYFQIPFTQTYVINPAHCITERPSNCHDEDMLVLDDQIPTINSYIRTLGRIASLIPATLDEMGPAKSRLTLFQAHRKILSLEAAFNDAMNKTPKFFFRDYTSNDTSPSWLPVARRSLAISASDKIIMIHRPILFHSFREPALARSRRICTSAAMTILREHEAVFAEKCTPLWTHSAFCVTAAIVLGLELLFRDAHMDQNAIKLRSTLANTAVRLRGCKCDVIAARGAALIATMLNVEEQLVLRLMRQPVQESSSARALQLELVEGMIESNEILAQFLTLSVGHTPSSPSHVDNTQQIDGLDDLWLAQNSFVEGDSQELAHWIQQLEYPFADLQ